MLSRDGGLMPLTPKAVLAAALSRISLSSFASGPFTPGTVVTPGGSVTGSLVTPASKGAPFWATTAGLSRWKIWLFVHLAPPWQEAQLAPNTVSPAVVSAGFG